MNKINVTKSFLPSLQEYTKELEIIWNTHWLTNNGEIHNNFNKQLRDYLKVENSSLFVNGHSALDIAIRALNLTGEVITTPFTFASTTHAIVMNNLTPIFCDINFNNYTMDTTKIEELITEKTSAIIPVHVYGNPCDVFELERISKKYNLKLIYDAAHTFGVEVDGKGIGTFGDVSMFSFHSTKVFHTIEGGALTYKNDEYRSKFDMYKNFGITGPEDVKAVGMNSKMNEFQAAMGIVNLRYIDEQISKRKLIVERYRENLKNIKGISYLTDVKNIKHNYSYFPIIINENEYTLNRNQLTEKLAQNNIIVRKYFYPLTNTYECYRGKFNSSKTPNAKYISERVMTLPLYADLTFSEIDYICNIIRSV